jgi:hypothetical protein
MVYCGCSFCSNTFYGDTADKMIHCQLRFPACAPCLLKILPGLNRQTQSMVAMEKFALLLDYCSACQRDMPFEPNRPDINLNYMYQRFENGRVCSVCQAQREDAAALRSVPGSGDFTTEELKMTENMEHRKE